MKNSYLLIVCLLLLTHQQIPKNTKTATIFLYDLSGKQVKSIPITERGKTDITVYARNLTAGMYIYNLVVDGQVKVTRRMIVSEV